MLLNWLKEKMCCLLHGPSNAEAFLLLMWFCLFTFPQLHTVSPTPVALRLLNPRVYLISLYPNWIHLLINYPISFPISTRGHPRVFCERDSSISAAFPPFEGVRPRVVCWDVENIEERRKKFNNSELSSAKSKYGFKLCRDRGRGKVLLGCQVLLFLLFLL